ncbi:MAG: SAM-dependent methyltransferase [Runella sp.]
MPATLYLLPAPLAPDTSLKVLSPQVLACMADIDFFFVENIRTARRLISSLKIGKVIDRITFYELHKDTPPSETRVQLQALAASHHNAGILSEAGCPGIADPGAVAVGIAHELGIEVVPLVGPSSLLLALMASGFNGQSFIFHGYLPIERAARIQTLKQLEKEAISKHQTQLFIETPYRNNALLEDILHTCQPNTRLCIACNLTAADGFVKTQTVRQWKTSKPDLHKKPTVFLLGV